MDLYRIEGGGLEPVRSDQFKLESEIQTLVESNMESLFGITMVTSEFSVGNFRLDSLCFDEESKSFVIVEYKRGSSYSVVDQGYSYLSVMLNNQAEFILEYNEKFDTPLKKVEVDWSSSRVVFVSPSFNTYQRNSVNFKDVPFELWEIKRFDGELVMLEQIRSSSDQSVQDITGPDKGGVISDVSKEVKVVSESDHVKGASKSVSVLWSELRSRYQDQPDVSIYANKSYVGMKRGNKLFGTIRFSRNRMVIDFLRGDIKTDGSKSRGFFELEDPKGMSEERSWTYKDGVIGNSYLIKFSKPDDLEYVVYLLNQKYESLG
jgi:hypothetical protein